jgi:hypothetical protein
MNIGKLGVCLQCSATILPALLKFVSASLNGSTMNAISLYLISVETKYMEKLRPLVVKYLKGRSETVAIH